MNLYAVPTGPGSDPSAAGRAVTRAAENERLSGLLNQSARGHEDAFAALYDATSARIYGVVLRVLRAPDHAAEVTQEVYVEIWQKSASFSESRGSAAGWMTTIAHRRAVDRVRSVESAVARDDKHARASVERSTDTVWDGVEQTLDGERVREAMSSLTAIQREALTLAYFGGYSQSQVAELLNLPLGTVKTRIRDGLIGLRDAWGVGTDE